MRACLLALAVLVSACGGAVTSGSPPPSASPSGSPTPTAPLAEANLKYRILDRFGPLAFCDPDYYPIARADEQVLAHQRLPEIQKDAVTFGAILVHLAIAANPPYTADQELAIYRDWKMLNALRLEAAGGTFHFTGVFVGFGSPSTSGITRVDGTIDDRGTIAVSSQTPSGRPPCPICLARGSRIATPLGDVAVEDLRVDDLVWTRDPDGHTVAAPLLEVGSAVVPATHRMVRLELADGRTVSVSPGHPTADGRLVGELRPGAVYDGATVTGANLVAYDGGRTFDILPAGATGTYWADGVLLGSTLR